MGKDILGKEIMEKYGGWTMFAKFFDNMDPVSYTHLPRSLDCETGQRDGSREVPPLLIPKAHVYGTACQTA